MNKLKKSFHRNSGFTLIELLIVIAIIGILAAVMLLVINPTRVQNRARNAAVKSTLSKVAFAVNGARAATGKVPTGDAVQGELENSTSYACTASTTTLDCTFVYTPTALPATCDTGLWNGTNETNQCKYKIVGIGTLVDGRFRVAAKRYKMNPVLATETPYTYIFDSIEGLKMCTSAVAAAALVNSASLSTITGCADAD